jgi:uncharacterized membrane protein YhhN
MSFNNELMATDSTLLAMSIGAAIIYGIKARQSPTHLRMAAKTISTALLSVRAALHGEPTLLVTALAFGAIGDAFLAWDGETAFISGLASFLAAHIFYIVLFVQNGRGVLQLQSDSRRVAVAITITILAPVMLVLLIPRVGRELRIPIFAYSSAISAMVLMALTMANDQIVLGAVLFTISDFFLATDKFLLSPKSTHRTWMQHTVWVLYYSGQLLISMGFSATLGYI